MITDTSRRLLKESRSAKIWIQMLLDHVVVQGLLFAHTFVRTDEFSNEYRILAIFTFLLMTIIYKVVGVYRHEAANSDYIASLLQAWGILVLLLGVFGFITKTSADFSRGVILTWALTGFLGQCIVYYLTRKILFRTLHETIPTLIIGGGDLGMHIARHINSNPWIPDHVVGYADDDPSIKGDWQSINAARLGGLADIQKIVSDKKIRRVYITTTMAESNLVKSLALNLMDSNVDVIWAPDIFDVSLLNYSIKEMAGVPLIYLSETPLLGGPALAKTLMDKVFAMIALLVVSPIMILTAIAVKMTSHGPILFKQKRHGWDGRVLEIYKFRSMKQHEEANGQLTQAVKNDDRLTVIGSFIRRSSIDELPQLFNVLGGSMSLVGPRPHAIAHNDFYKGEISAFMSRHRIKPGLTGLAQVNGFRGETDTIDKMQNRLNYDLDYINNWSLWLDCEILFKTFFVLFDRNAY